MTNRTDDGLTGRVLMALVSAMADKNYNDAKAHLLVLAREHGVGIHAERVMAQSIALTSVQRAASGRLFRLSGLQPTTG